MDKQIYFEWETPEYEASFKSNDWFWGLGFLTLITVVLSIFYKNYIFAIMICIGVISLMYLKVRAPKNITITINDRLLKIGEEPYFFQDILAFWIDTKSENEQTLLIALKKPLNPIIAVTIPEHIPLKKMRSVLLQHIEEKLLRQAKIYTYMEKLGF